LDDEEARMEYILDGGSNGHYNDRIVKGEFTAVLMAIYARAGSAAVSFKARI
jgi:hypothetical protein